MGGLRVLYDVAFGIDELHSPGRCLAQWREEAGELARWEDLERWMIYRGGRPAVVVASRDERMIHGVEC